jgi:hypothetical protein
MTSTGESDLSSSERTVVRTREAATILLAQRVNTRRPLQKLIIGEAERRFPCRIELDIPMGGFGAQLAEMHACRSAIRRGGSPIRAEHHGDYGE